MRAVGFIVYAGQGHLSDSIFRVADMGQISLAEISRFATALGDLVQFGSEAI